MKSDLEIMLIFFLELVKGERGLGFSILDYQDPLRPSHTLVVIRSLVPGGVAQQDGRLIPGDRLLFVNDQVSLLFVSFLIDTIQRIYFVVKTQFLGFCNRYHSKQFSQVLRFFRFLLSEYIQLMFVQNLENASLEQAVAALKGAPRGVVRIGVAKPLPLADAPPPLPASAPPAPLTPTD